MRHLDISTVSMLTKQSWNSNGDQLTKKPPKREAIFQKRPLPDFRGPAPAGSFDWRGSTPRGRGADNTLQWLTLSAAAHAVGHSRRRPPAARPARPQGPWRAWRLSPRL